MRKGILFVISGPSGAGKGTILKELLQRVDNLTFSVSATTRAKRDGELDGVNYFFMTQNEFAAHVANGDFLEHVEKYGNRYGTLKSFVETQLSKGVDVVFDIETRGAANIRNIMPESVLMFVTPSSKRELLKRLVNRGSESKKVRELRYSKATEELKEADKYDYIIVNDDLEDAVLDAEAIILAERTKIINNMGLIEKLQSEK